MKKFFPLLLCLLLLTCCVFTSQAEEDDSIVFFETLQFGDQDEAVKELQIILKDTGYYNGPLSGQFGSLTRTAVKAVQKAYSLPITGIADNDTQEIIFSSSFIMPLASGDTGEQVKRLQTRLKELGYYTKNVTGNYYQNTVAAVKAFQEAFDLEATGKADVNTLALLYSKAAEPTPTPIPTSTPVPTPTPVGMTPAPVQNVPFSKKLSYGSSGTLVEKVQQRLMDLGFFTYKKITGGYYTNTQSAVKAFQRLNGLDQTGTVDEMTWNILFNDPEVADSTAATPRPSPVPTPALYYFEVDVANQVTKVWKYDEATEGYTTLDRAFLCATGTTTYPSPIGTFTLSGRRAKYCEFPNWGGGQARWWTKINSEIAFHSVIYSDSSDITTLKVGTLTGLGKRGSHGCIRLTVADAKWIYENAKAGMQVWIHDDAPSDPELRYAVQPGEYDSRAYAPKTTPTPPVYTYDGTKIPEGEIRSLTVGSEGATVYWLQMKLREMGYFTGTVTGQYREGTQNAVRRFQADHELYQNGKANEDTLRCLYALVIEANATPTPIPTPEITATPAPTATPVLTPVPTVTPAP